MSSSKRETRPRIGRVGGCTFSHNTPDVSVRRQASLSEPVRGLLEFHAIDEFEDAGLIELSALGQAEHASHDPQVAGRSGWSCAPEANAVFTIFRDERDVIAAVSIRSAREFRPIPCAIDAAAQILFRRPRQLEMTDAVPALFNKKKKIGIVAPDGPALKLALACLLYTSDAADE